MPTKFFQWDRTAKRRKEGTAINTSAGVGDANKIVETNAAGVLDATLMPPGFGVSVKSYTAFEAIAAGKLVNIFDDAGTGKVRLADATAASSGKRAHGFSLLGAASGAACVTYISDDLNTAVTGLATGTEYYLGTAGGVVTAAASTTTAGQTVQRIGVADSATVLVVSIDEPLELA